MPGCCKVEREEREATADQQLTWKLGIKPNLSFCMPLSGPYLQPSRQSVLGHHGNPALSSHVLWSFGCYGTRLFIYIDGNNLHWIHGEDEEEIVRILLSPISTPTLLILFDPTVEYSCGHRHSSPFFDRHRW